MMFYSGRIKEERGKTLPPPAPPDSGGELKTPPPFFKEGVGGWLLVIYF
jgi:hypothetical protein